MTSLMRLAVFLIVALAATACLDPIGSACTTEVAHSIVVEVRDSVTNEPAALGATLLVQTPEGLEPAAGHGHALLITWGEERSGTFDVTVRKEGYHDWVRRGVPVPSGTCHVQTANLIARLQPLE